MTSVYLPLISPLFTQVVNSSRFVVVDRDLHNPYWDVDKYVSHKSFSNNFGIIFSLAILQ